MASVTSTVRILSPLPPRRSPVSTTYAKGTLCRCRSISSSEKTPSDGTTRLELPPAAIKRRETLLQIVLSAVSLPVIAGQALAETDLQESLRTYEDETNKFRIMIPREWSVGAGDADGIKSVTAFYPTEASDSNVSVVITGLGPDFTRLESFGSVDAFAESLVSGLDRSWQRPPGLAAKLVDSRKANGLYYIEYTLQSPGERRRHLLSAIGMASNGWYNRLYTVTGQFMDDESDKYRSQIEKVVSSFRLK